MALLEMYPNVADIVSNTEIKQERTMSKGITNNDNTQEDNVEEGSGRADAELVPEGGNMT